MADVSLTPSAIVPSPLSTTLHLSPPSTLAGEAIDAGDIVCLLASDSKYYKADANDSAKRDVKGMAGNSAVAIGQRVDIISETPSITVGTHGVTIGVPLFLSNTPGKLCPFADVGSTTLCVLCAYAVSSTALQIILAPSSTPKA